MLRRQSLQLDGISQNPGVETQTTGTTDLGSLPVRKVKAKACTPPIPTFSSGESLQDRLLAEFNYFPRGGKAFFLPIKSLESLIQEQNVVIELTRCLPASKRPKIPSNARRICATPIGEIIIEKADSILKFLSEGVRDADLPLMKLELDGKPGIFKFGRKPERGKASHPLKCFQGFTRMNFINFENCQWAVLAPIFRCPSRKNVDHYCLEDQTILPFTEEEDVYEGGFGRVSRIRIHPDHHHFDPSKVCTISFSPDEMRRPLMRSSLIEI